MFQLICYSFCYYPINDIAKADGSKISNSLRLSNFRDQGNISVIEWGDITSFVKNVETC